MNNSSINNVLVLSRYLGEFEPATEENVEFRKSSHDIAQDLEDIVTLSVDDVTSVMLNGNFTLSFDDDTPVWLMKKRSFRKKAITE